MPVCLASTICFLPLRVKVLLRQKLCLTSLNIWSPVNLNKKNYYFVTDICKYAKFHEIGNDFMISFLLVANKIISICCVRFE